MLVEAILPCCFLVQTFTVSRITPPGEFVVVHTLSLPVRGRSAAGQLHYLNLRPKAHGKKKKKKTFIRAWIIRRT